ncbi:MAG: 1-acyl-sn-glycerol-3-phosphate acyltransferase [Planctomycetia bacterium]|nr:1-acyl-sn-glycerol-3-phosphate acyltransferase [Planctomycetia bacterium]
MLSDRATDVLALAVLSALAVAVAAVVWRDVRSCRCTLAQYGFYLFNRVYAGLMWRAEASGPLPLPDSSGGVIICNHRSGIDPNIVQLTTRRNIHFMIARQYFEHPLLGWCFRILDCIPVGRGGIDTKATRMAIRAAQSGGLVGVFPEGRINTTSDLFLPARPGAALIALKARVPVVSCFVQGSQFGGSPESSYFMRSHARITVGRPIELSAFFGREDEPGVLAEVTLLLMREMARLAGVPDYQPRLAGRQWAPPELVARPRE